MENSTEINKYDETILKIFEAENQSVNKFFDAIFGFFSRHSPELIFDTSKHYGKQLLVSNYEKWQNKYCNSQKSPVATSKRVKNNVELQEQVIQENGECWYDARNPGGLTQTTNTTTSTRTCEDNSTRITKSKQASKLGISNFDTTNGAVLDNYSWTQTVDDIDLRIPVVENIAKGNQVKVQIDKKRVKVEVNSLASLNFETVVEGDLAHPVRPDDCVWLLSPGQHIAILLEKLEEKWWDRCLENEPPIDLSKINAERDYHSLPVEDRIQIEKVILDKQREERGEPTSDQVKMESILRKAWNAEGSPFLGQPFDPSAVQVINSP